MTELEARESLERWRDHMNQRDSIIRAAHEAGVNKHQIHLITGIARTTINRILTSKDPK